MIDVIQELREFARKSGLKNSEWELEFLADTVDAEITAFSLMNEKFEEPAAAPIPKRPHPRNYKPVLTDLKAANRNGPNFSVV